jgi:hypothetical protein
LTRSSKPLKTLRRMIRDAVPTAIANTLTHAMILIALVDFFALKYLQAKVKYIAIPHFKVISCLNILSG